MVTAMHAGRAAAHRRRREQGVFLLLVLPNLVLLGVWTYWPFLYSIHLSLTNWNFLRPRRTFVGLANYWGLLTSSTFWYVVSNTILYTAGTVTVRLVLSLGLAALLNQPQVWLRPLWRLIIFSPHITTSAAMALVWLSIYDPNHGPLEAFLSRLGLHMPNVLASTTLVLPALMAVGIWKGLGFSTVIFLAALQIVPRELRESAAVDGAGAWHTFRHVTVPAISPVTYFLVITGVIDAFQTFDIVSVMTGGGPADASTLYVYYLYREAFHFYRAGYASAIAVLFLLVMMTLTYAQSRLARRWVHY
jgi:multiple sugar transport system permease protein/sn-glycerol 3-phosphate transport system permease protein